MKFEKIDYLIIIGSFLIAFVIRSHNVSIVSKYPDEELYLLKIHRILINNFIPTEKVFDYAPPLIQYIEAVVTLLFNGDLDTLRMVSVIFGSLAVPFMYLFGKTMYNKKVGILPTDTVYGIGCDIFNIKIF